MKIYKKEKIKKINNQKLKFMKKIMSDGVKILIWNFLSVAIIGSLISLMEWPRTISPSSSKEVNIFSIEYSGLEIGIIVLLSLLTFTLIMLGFCCGCWAIEVWYDLKDQKLRKKLF